jgi:aryl-alcohol dehydrogenase-like predicted oxidoreductase
MVVDPRRRWLGRGALRRNPHMKYRSLGASGLMVSPICLGTMNFGNRTDRAEAGRIVDSAREAGVNFIDTADIYAQGESERIVGEVIAKDRDWWVLATKVGEPMGDSPNRKGLSARWIKKAAHDSLRRLGTDRIDIYYAHLDDESTPLEETLRALDNLIRAGDVLYVGLSNYPSWRIAEIVHLCRELGLAPPIVCQPYYHMFTRTPEAELLPACAHYGLGVVSYSPLARGILSGKYSVDTEPPADSRAGRGDGMTSRMMETEWRRESLVIAQDIKARAEVKGMTTGQFALNWVLNNALVSAVIPGPRTLGQWTEYLGALEYRLDSEDEEFVDGLVPPGYPTTLGYRDPETPLRGRIPVS